MDDVVNGEVYPAEGHNFAREQLRAIVERVQALDEQIKELNADKSEIFQEAKANGFDVKTIKKVIAILRKPAAERDEEQALLDLYLAQVGG